MNTTQKPTLRAVARAKARAELAERRAEEARNRAEQAEQRAAQARTFAEQVKSRVESAETRAEQAETRTEFARTRTEQAEIRAEQAEIRAEQAKTRAEQAEARAELAERRALEAEAIVEDLVQTLIKLPLMGAAPAATTPDRSGLRELPPRQREVLQLIAAGHNTKQMAAVMNVSPKTVEYHRLKLMRVLNIHDIPGLVRFALRIGLGPSES